ncbi:hypothetical protein FB99_20710 [Pantoea agglomerans]|nr:hypothetical protein FB99_20710 [Pantoea agglomerans]
MGRGRFCFVFVAIFSHDKPRLAGILSIGCQIWLKLKRR